MKESPTMRRLLVGLAVATLGITLVACESTSDTQSTANVAGGLAQRTGL
jgi:hypothetical protein